MHSELVEQVFFVKFKCLFMVYYGGCYMLDC
jgi:hypothetical protein